jgi:hypothetical protein
MDILRLAKILTNVKSWIGLSEVHIRQGIAVFVQTRICVQKILWNSHVPWVNWCVVYCVLCAGEMFACVLCACVLCTGEMVCFCAMCWWTGMLVYCVLINWCACVLCVSELCACVPCAGELCAGELVCLCAVYWWIVCSVLVNCVLVC